MDELPHLLILARGRLTVVEAARLAGLSPRMIEHYERGRKLPKASTLDRIIAAWGVPFRLALQLRSRHMRAIVQRNVARASTP